MLCHGFSIVKYGTSTFSRSYECRIWNCCPRSVNWNVSPLYSADDDMDDIWSPDDDHPRQEEREQWILAQRIQQLQEKEAEEDQAFSEALSVRVQEVEQSETMKDMISTTTTDDSEDPTATNGTARNEARVVHLPVVCFDALLPQQPMEGRTEDPNFSVFLRDLGLGGWFVMTSLDPTKRKVRRHGVLAKIVAVDALKAPSTTPSTNNINPLSDIPTAVDFQIMAQTRCRIIHQMDPTEPMKARIGRWRRGYDPNGEEVALGWGVERFLDTSPELVMDPKYETNSDNQDSGVLEENEHKKDNEWNDVPILVHLDAVEDPATSSPEMQTKVNDLATMVDEWYNLASKKETYQNLNVTAATRIQRNEPGLWVEPDKLLSRVAQQLGPRPPLDDVTAFCFWATAMINPMPPLGVSLEIRGQLLEAPTVQRRLEILELGLRRSIDNLRGTRPLI